MRRIEYRGDKYDYGRPACLSRIRPACMKLVQSWMRSRADRATLV